MNYQCPKPTSPAMDSKSRLERCDKRFISSQHRWYFPFSAIVFVFQKLKGLSVENWHLVSTNSKLNENGEKSRVQSAYITKVKVPFLRFHIVMKALWQHNHCCAIVSLAVHIFKSFRGLVIIIYYIKFINVWVHHRLKWTRTSSEINMFLE